ncbi:MAG: hypothetical protein AAFV29_19680, partial [Myxococcota bacterium]
GWPIVDRYRSFAHSMVPFGLYSTNGTLCRIASTSCGLATWGAAGFLEDLGLSGEAVNGGLSDFCCF